MVTLTETIDIAAPFERLNAWADNFEEELDNLYLEDILVNGVYPARIPKDEIKNHSPKELMEALRR